MLYKGANVSKPQFVSQFMPKTPKFDLVEIMGFRPDSGIQWLEEHLTRLKSSAQELGFEFDRHATRNTLNAACFTLDEPTKIRLALAKGGHIAIEMRRNQQGSNSVLRVALATLALPVDHVQLRHCTTNRDFYDDVRREFQHKQGVDDVIFINSNGHISKSVDANIFVEKGDILLTPPLSAGVSAGILRQNLLDSGKAQEADIMPDDLKNGFYLGNSVTGLVSAQLA